MSYSKLPKSKNKSEYQQTKKQKSKPQWSTDFIDRDQYKLSASQMIQKKAALQSKNREQARQQLQQRRRKLEMGILDQQTKKIYETALTSKNIDINPPMRRNLTQMIRYEKEQRQKFNDQGQQNQQQQNQQQGEGQDQSIRDIKQAQDFIRKFEKAKKQQKIQRAVQILTNNKTEKLQNRNNGVLSPSRQVKTNNFLDSMNNQKSYGNKSKGQKSSNNISQQEAISSIQDTIRFMEQKLFAAKKTFQQNSKSFINQSDQDQSFTKQNNFNDYNKMQTNHFKKTKPTFYPQQTKTVNQSQFFKKSNNSKAHQINFTTTNNFYKNNFDNQFDQKIGQISQLRINLKNQNSSDDECLDTIRRMRQLMEDKQVQCDSNRQRKKPKSNLRDNVSPNSLGFNSTIHKNQLNSQSEVQVSFNLTLNNQDDYYQQSSILKDRKRDQSNKMIRTQDIYKPFQRKVAKHADQNKKSKQDEYEQEYERIKQNLFQCINQNPKQSKSNTQVKKNSSKNNMIKKYQEDSQEESQDSLMVKDRINMWKKQLEPQQEPQDQQDQIQFKTTTFGKKNVTNSRPFVKINDDQEQEEDVYKFNFLNQNPNKKIPIKDKIQQLSYDTYSNQGFQQSNSLKNQKMGQSMKKPPMMKKAQQADNHLNAMKQMISKASSQIKKIQIQPLKIQPLHPTGQVLGFDFRGSINIKKNILSK